MYSPPHFVEGDREEILSFLQEHPLATLVSPGSGRMECTHIPLLIHQAEPELVLRGHVRKKTDHWTALHANPEVLAIFTGPTAPILASWQTAPFGGTYNYMTVHIRGRVTFLPENGLRQTLETLKNHFEVSPDHQFDLLPTDYVDRLVPAIEGIEIQVESIEATFKLSQNRSLQDFDRAAEELTKKGGESALVAEEMMRRRSRYYGE